MTNPANTDELAQRAGANAQRLIAQAAADQAELSAFSLGGEIAKSLVDCQTVLNCVAIQLKTLPCQDSRHD